LPGYVWYAAAAWRAFPRAHRYVQVPVVILLTIAVAATAAALGGPMLGLLSGVIAALDPFMVVHGPVCVTRSPGNARCRSHRFDFHRSGRHSILVDAERSHMDIGRVRRAVDVSTRTRP
jgi:hypothetical protein